MAATDTSLSHDQHLSHLSASEIKKFRKSIDRSNKRFRKLSTKGKRIAVAKDVLKQIKAERIAAKRQRWVDADGQPFSANRIGASVQEIVCDETFPSCQVCGLGAMFLSAVRLNNKLTIGYGPDDIVGVVSARAVVTYLGTLFPDKIVKLIEYTFEGGEGLISSVPLAAAGKADAFAYKYPDADDRLVAIMKNVVKNEGAFKP